MYIIIQHFPSISAEEENLKKQRRNRKLLQHNYSGKYLKHFLYIYLRQKEQVKQKRDK